MGVKHWHKWTLHWMPNERGYMVGNAMICEECGARKRTRYVGSYIYSEYARPDREFESIKTGTHRNHTLLKSWANTRRYDAIAVLAWRQHEYGEGTVEDCAERLGWDLGRRALMAKGRPTTIALSDDQQRYNGFDWNKSDDPRDPGPIWQVLTNSGEAEVVSESNNKALYKRSPYILGIEGTK